MVAVLSRPHGLIALAALALAAMALPSPPAFAQASGGSGVPVVTGESAAARQDRIEELEFIIRQTSAENDQLQLELRQARQENQRLQQIISDMAAAQRALEETRADQAAPAPPSPGVTPSQTVEEAREAATGTLGTLPAVDNSAEAAASYRRARELLLGAPLPDAQAAFAQYLQQFPNGADVADARYWFAFTLLGQGSYRDAAVAFADYLERHGSDNGPRAHGPAALLRLGISLAGAGMMQEACAAFRDTDRHPRASAGTRAQAQQEARRNNCPA